MFRPYNPNLNPNPNPNPNPKPDPNPNPLNTLLFLKDAVLLKWTVWTMLDFDLVLFSDLDIDLLPAGTRTPNPNGHPI